jgi:hypothetical protein
MLFVAHIIVALVLGAFYWGEVQGFSLGVRRAEAFNVLIAAQARGRARRARSWRAAEGGLMPSLGRAAPPKSPCTSSAPAAPRTVIPLHTLRPARRLESPSPQTPTAHP